MQENDWVFFFHFLRRRLRLHLCYGSSQVHFLVFAFAFALAPVNQALLFKPHKPTLDLDKTPTTFFTFQILRDAKPRQLG